MHLPQRLGIKHKPHLIHKPKKLEHGVKGSGVGSGGQYTVRKATVNGPSESVQWKKLEPYQGKIKTSGTGKNRRYYNWDHTHKDIEVYGSNIKYLGSMDPTTGKMYKPAVNGRKLSR